MFDNKIVDNKISQKMYYFSKTEANSGIEFFQFQKTFCLKIV